MKRLAFSASIALFAILVLLIVPSLRNGAANVVASPIPAATHTPAAIARPPTAMPTAVRLSGAANVVASPTPAATHTPAAIARPPTAMPATEQPSARSTAAPTTVSGSRLPAFKHIFLIVMENKEATQVSGNTSAPYLNMLATRYARASNYHAITHPSLPNYLALTGGDTFGITSDCIDCTVAQTNLVDQLEAGGKSWKAYMEGMPRPCFTGNAAPYAQKHNPFIYYDTVRNDPARCNKIVPFSQFATDMQANSVPDFVWITPNLCNDMHDCSIATGDQWLKKWVSMILASSAWKDQGVLFITFDEGNTQSRCCTYGRGGKVDTLVISPLVQSGTASDVAYDHYALLRTIEEAWGLSPLRKADCACSTPMTALFQHP